MSPYQLNISPCFDNTKKAETVLITIKPELNSKHARRSNTSVKVKNNTLLIDIKADDATALRAAANGILNSIILSKNMMEV